MDVENMLAELHAGVCKALASPRRIQIINLLREGEMHVDELASRMGASKGNVSQHLAILREKGVVTSRKEGLNVFYRIANPKIIQACDLMREVMLERLTETLSATQKLLQVGKKERR
ncbi:MAG: winged helix-turn-helix transcriptional regulator [Firmicutes bacterium]|nr:winged helix-turn-helix transcriptional regulator [Bacillota bacterium]